MTTFLEALRTSVCPPAALLGPLAAALSLLWIDGLHAAPKTDVVTLVNGDRITGEVKELDKGVLRYSTDSIGTVSVEWEDVAQLQSVQLFEVELVDGTKVYGRPKRPGDPGSLALENEDGRGVRQVPVDHAVRIAALEEGRLRDRLDGYLNIGWSAAAASDVSQVSLGAGVTYRDQFKQWQLDYNATNSESDSNPSSRSQELKIEQQRFLRERLFWVGTGSYETNDELGLDLRLLLGGGFGRYFIQTHRQELVMSTGLAVTREEFSDGQAQESLEGFLGGSYDLFHFDDPEIDVSTRMVVFPSFTVSGRVRTAADVTISYELIKDFTHQLSLTYTYDSKPQSVGAPQSDWSLFTSLGYQF